MHVCMHIVETDFTKYLQLQTFACDHYLILYTRDLVLLLSPLLN